MTERRPVAGWVVYDLANTIFALGVVGLYLPEWMTREGVGDSTLALTQSIAGVVVVFLAPWIGAVTDHHSRRMPALALTTAIAVAATAGLTWGPVGLTFALLGLALVAVNTGSVVYDALLPTVADPADQGHVSGLGVGVGYLGSFIGVGVGVVTLDLLDVGYGPTFLALASGFALFSIPTWMWVREPATTAPRGHAPRITGVVGGLVVSWRRASEHPPVVRFLLSRFLYTDAINTLIGGFLTIFAIEELGLDRRGSQALLVVAITAAIAGGLGGGRLVARIGPVPTLRLALAGWVVGITTGVVAAIAQQPSWAPAIGVVGGLSLGATWASDRIVMIRISPPDRLGEFYGLYATVGRFATILGPLVWALVVDRLDLGRNVAMATLAGFVALGWWMVGAVAPAASGEAFPGEDERRLR